VAAQTAVAKKAMKTKAMDGERIFMADGSSFVLASMGAGRTRSMYGGFCRKMEDPW
jgi:hypothetical protein